MLQIDGSFGSGSGTIIRLAMALSSITKIPFKITNVRAKRCNPGLQEQHLQVVNSINELCNGEVKGNFLHSNEIEFYPGNNIKDNIKIDIRTSGSIGLLLQSVMLPCFFLGHKKTKIEITGGGTLGKFSPNLLYTKDVFLPIIKKMGFDADIDIVKHGFYPKGGADVISAIYKNEDVKGLNIFERGKLLSIKSIALVSSDLREKEVAERMNSYAGRILKDKYNVKISVFNEYTQTLSTGVGLLLIANFENTILAWDALGEKNKRSEDVAKEAVVGLIKQIESNCTLDEYMSDQILPYLAFSKEKCSFKFPELTEHIETNIWLLEKFLNKKLKIKNNLVLNSS